MSVTSGNLLGRSWALLGHPDVADIDVRHIQKPPGPLLGAPGPSDVADMDVRRIRKPPGPLMGAPGPSGCGGHGCLSHPETSWAAPGRSWAIRMWQHLRQSKVCVAEICTMDNLNNCVWVYRLLLLQLERLAEQAQYQGSVGRDILSCHGCCGRAGEIYYNSCVCGLCTL